MCFDSTSKKINNNLENTPTIDRRKTRQTKHSKKGFTKIMFESDERFTCDKNTNSNSKASELSVTDLVQANIYNELEDESHPDSTIKK